MARPSKQVISILIIFVAIGVILGVKYYKESQSVEGVLISRSKGDENAPLKVVEFIDFECPACAFGAQLLKKFMLENPGIVHLELKYFPLRAHRHGLLSAKYAECAARQGKFWLVHDLLVERQSQWKKLMDAKPAFRIIAEDADLDLKKLDQCLVDESVGKFIAKNKEEGRLKGIRRTPTYFVNDEIVVGANNLSIKLNQFLTSQSD